MAEIPVYLFTGFLEAGKTKFIQETLEDKRFNNGEKTLLLMCEEGIEEIDASKFSGRNVYIQTIEAQSELTGELLSGLYKKYKFERAVVEYNGMWMLDALYANMPKGWTVYQEMMFADCKTFLAYNSNMRSLMADKLKSAEMVIFNRADDTVDKEAFHKIVRTMSKNAQIAYEYSDGHVEYDEIEDPLPFDIDAPVIEIKDEDYAIWYRDMAEDMKKYDGKVVSFTTLAAKNAKIPPDVFIAGRHIMTCCAEDITYSALVCEYEDAKKIKNKSWVKIKARFTHRYHALYQSDGPVLKIISVEKGKEPENPVATFY